MKVVKCFFSKIFEKIKNIVKKVNNVIKKGSDNIKKAKKNEEKVVTIKNRIISFVAEFVVFYTLGYCNGFKKVFMYTLNANYWEGYSMSLCEILKYLNQNGNIIIGGIKQ